MLSKEIDIKKRILSQVANEFLQVIKIKDLNKESTCNDNYFDNCNL